MGPTAQSSSAVVTTGTGQQLCQCPRGVSQLAWSCAPCPLPPLACEAHGVSRDFLPVVSGWVLAADTVAACQFTAGATGPHGAWAQGQLAGLQACGGRAVSLGCRNAPHPAPKVAPGTEGAGWAGAGSMGMPSWHPTPTWHMLPVGAHGHLLGDPYAHVHAPPAVQRPQHLVVGAAVNADQGHPHRLQEEGAALRVGVRVSVTRAQP